MDSGKARTRYLIAAALLCAAGPPAAVAIGEMRWLAQGTPIEQLDQMPAECMAWPRDHAARRSAEIGRILFRAPLLLGGQAARVGLSCASCHRNGRGNPNFHFPGISGQPGTADVTASLLSSHRGDGMFNPKPIPDLAADPASRIVSRDPARPDLRRFIHGLITEEFDGPEPPPAVLDGVAAYVRAIDSSGCADGGTVQVGASNILAEIERALRLAESEPEPATSRALIAAARSDLGRIDERFGLPGLERERALLAAADSELLALRNSTDAGRSAPMWRDWNRRWPELKRRITAAAPNSLFSEARLRTVAKERTASRD